MALSYTDAVGDGIAVTFPFSFAGPDNGYFRPADIVAEIDGVVTAYTLTGPTQVTFAVPPADQAKVRIRRLQPNDTPYTDFKRGNAFGQVNVNRSFLQQLFLVHEFMDGFKITDYYEKQHLNMGTNYRITNMADAVDPQDAMAFHQLGDHLEETEAARDAALAAAAASSGYADDALGHAEDAQAWAESIVGDRDAAAASAAAALASENAAAASALAAANSEAGVAADALAASNSAAAALASEGNALTYANAAGVSAAAALVSEGAASTSETNALNSAAAAALSASNALTSEGNALTHANAAGVSAAAALVSEGNAAQSEIDCQDIVDNFGTRAGDVTFNRTGDSGDTFLNANNSAWIPVQHATDSGSIGGGSTPVNFTVPIGGIYILSAVMKFNTLDTNIEYIMGRFVVDSAVELYIHRITVIEGNFLTIPLNFIGYFALNSVVHVEFFMWGGTNCIYEGENSKFMGTLIKVL